MTSVLALIAGLSAVQTIGPAGFYDLCAAERAECLPVAETRQVSLDEIGRINLIVNKDIHPMPDPAGKDIWTIGPRDGDCEDYAMTKRRDLIAAGLGSAEARVAVGVASGQLHAVLVVSFGSRFYVLDNLTDEVLPVEGSAVRLVSIQSLENPRIWLRAEGSQTVLPG